MQTEIKTDLDAGSPGQLTVLPSFNSAAKVRSCKVTGDIYPGDAVKDGTTDNEILAIVPGTDADTLVTGIAVRSHENVGALPTFSQGWGDTPTQTNSTQGSCEDGPIFVKLAAGQTPKNGDLATPIGRNATTNHMEWGVLTGTGVSSRVEFKSGVLNGNVAIVRVYAGAPLGN
ncbi:structural cement protein Gp24 [Kosakonia sacchari]|uniref:structural cement protein Gp24 n=1 Tax=Kosakonia sacchari TaxID=1158459 RepID=UPI0015849166|nr:hypothetical protein [Kosakonia sacchari]NUL35052.1 hypothetical protein [Kosakonia sacchari]